MRKTWISLALVSTLTSVVAGDFSTIEPLLQEHCVECHTAQDPEAGLVLESHAGVMKGGESGPAVIPGKGAESLLVRVLEGRWGKTGKNEFMPPGKRPHLKPDQIAQIRAWIDEGAQPASTNRSTRPLEVPRIAPRGTVRHPITALAFHAGSRLLAVARTDALDLVSIETRKPIRSLKGFQGAVYAVAFSPDGKWIVTGGGDATGGDVRRWNVSEGTIDRAYPGHRDAVHAVAVSPDGASIAAGGYDYGIGIWNVADGVERHRITGSQGAIMGLGFRPDGKVLASVGYDRTAKLYDPATGTRLETLGQALREVTAMAFSPDGRVLLTGGNDNRIRIYRVGPDVREGSVELVDTVFAHEGGLLQVVYSPDGRRVASSAQDQTVKLFEAEGLKPVLTLERQPDWPSALVFTGNDQLVVGRADGTLGFYQASDGKASPPPKPELFRTSPRGAQRGVTNALELLGRNLERATVLLRYQGGTLRSAESLQVEGDSARVTWTPDPLEPLGAWEFAVSDGTTESAQVKVWVDDLPQQEIPARAASDRQTPATVRPPVSVWSTLEKPGQELELQVELRQGQRVVLDLAAQRLGAAGDLEMIVTDSTGRTVARSDNLGADLDPLIRFLAPADALYRVRVREGTHGGSASHFLRLSLGELPFVSGIFPLTVSTQTATPVTRMGENLGDAARVVVNPSEPGELSLPEASRALRARREWKVRVVETPAPLEVEPNHDPKLAQEIPVPCTVNGQIWPGGDRPTPDVDLFRFQARKGTRYLLETLAARRGSTADTRIEVLWPDGRPVERVRLQALRNSAITFRPETSDDSGIRFENWEEMELNDLLWCGGEVMKLFRAPQGPDSDSVLYVSNGRRRGFFDTSPTAHYVDEPVYLVRPLAPGETPIANGLPVFTVPHLNDDAALRDLGTDSRLEFTAPVDGPFLVRITDPQGPGGPEASYALVVRETAPDFKATLTGANPTVARGSGQGFGVSVERVDGFDGPVRVEFLHLPPGWSIAGPVVVEAGHDSVQGTLRATPDAVAPSDADWDAVTVIASAEVEGRPVVQAVNSIGRPRLAPEPPKLRVHLEPVGASTTNAVGLRILDIAPGGTATARLRIERRDFDGVVTFSVDNLPHGVIVENLGLNGITFLPEESERDISLAAVKWVSDLERPFHAVENQAGRQTSEPLLLRVRKTGPAGTATHPR